MTTRFEQLFGISPAYIHENVLLLPLIPKGFLKNLGLERLNKGRLYACGNTGGLTVIQTGMGAPLVGDGVLYLKDSKCKNVFLLGSCGAFSSRKGLNIGSCVVPEKCRALESFTKFLLEEENDGRVLLPDAGLMNDFLKFVGPENARTAVCATVSSLKLEEDRHAWFLNQGIEIADMECSAFYSAAAHAGLSALAVFYVSDIIKENPFYEGVFASLPEKILKCVLDFLGQKVIKVS